MTLRMILAMDKKGGIGLRGHLPWHNKEELGLFKKWTWGCPCIVGSKTANYLPPLKNRKIHVLSRSGQQSLNSIISQYEPETPVWVIGGAEIYNHALKSGKVETIIMSVMDKEYECDTFMKIPSIGWAILYQTPHNRFTQYILETQRHQEDQYLKCIKDVLENGEKRASRNSVVRSQFNKNLSFDLTEGFPLLTTKKMFTEGIINELLFFLKGETDTKILEDKGINIWKGNTNREFLDTHGFTKRSAGVMGPMYGYQWRFYGAPYSEDLAIPMERGVDQLSRLIESINHEPSSRRHLLTTYNPAQVHEGVLYPCHSIVNQFYVSEGGYLDMFCYNRSSDLFLGLPFNIASSALFQHIIAHYTGLQPRWMHITLGDAHIYENHVDAVKTQLDRIPFTPPCLELRDMPDDMRKLRRDNFVFHSYKSHPRIKADMVA